MDQSSPEEIVIDNYTSDDHSIVEISGKDFSKRVNVRQSTAKTIKGPNTMTYYRNQQRKRLRRKKKYSAPEWHLKDEMSCEIWNEETKKAMNEEKERKIRLEKKQLLENQILNQTDKCLYLDINDETKRGIVPVDPEITAKLKPHQREGVKFIWNSVFERVNMIKKGHKGSGCILAHCMGLGKTLQIVAIVHTLIANCELTKVKRVLIIMPVSVLINWRKEFEHWTQKCRQKILIYEVPYYNVTEPDMIHERVKELKNWYNTGGVLFIGYRMFVQLLKNDNSIPEDIVQNLRKFLLSPGADLVVCDEGHALKNSKTGLSQCVNQIQTRRRIVLTGTPIQNNLKECYCMVSFVKPNLLGEMRQFEYRFATPIKKGQDKNSSPFDVMFMKKRAHVLYDLLSNFVHRKDYHVIENELPKKHEYVISLRLSTLQIQLYEAYLKTLSNKKLLRDIAVFLKILNHPRAIVDTQDRDEELDLDELVEELEESLMQNKDSRQDKELKKKGEENKFWWKEIIGDEDALGFGNETSGKFALFVKILRECERIGDKLIVFSQSLTSLDLIEELLSYLTKTNGERWSLGMDYFRIDGQTSIEYREEQIEKFNDVNNKRARLFLISIKAGSVGINLVGANRSILLDTTWNPANERQAIFRTYRMRQTKDVFIYRFISKGTIEEKIYKRQVIKQSLSQRVIDNHQLARHFTRVELAELYSFEPDLDTQIVHKIPEDDLLKSLLQECKQWIFKYHEHDSLLENKLDEALTEEERQLAIREFQEDDSVNRTSQLSNETNDLPLMMPGLITQSQPSSLITSSDHQPYSISQRARLFKRQKTECQHPLIQLNQNSYMHVNGQQQAIQTQTQQQFQSMREISNVPTHNEPMQGAFSEIPSNQGNFEFGDLNHLAQTETTCRQENLKPEYGLIPELKFIPTYNGPNIEAFFEIPSQQDRLEFTGFNQSFQTETTWVQNQPQQQFESIDINNNNNNNSFIKTEEMSMQELKQTKQSDADLIMIFDKKSQQNQRFVKVEPENRAQIVFVRPESQQHLNASKLKSIVVIIDEDIDQDVIVLRTGRNGQGEPTMTVETHQESQSISSDDQMQLVGQIQTLQVHENISQSETRSNSDKIFRI